MVESTEKRAKLFKNGQSQAVRLPKAFRFVGTEVRISRVKEGVLLEAIGPQIEAAEWAAVEKVLSADGALDAAGTAQITSAIKRLQTKPAAAAKRSPVVRAEQASQPQSSQPAAKRRTRQETPAGFALVSSLDMADL